MQFVIDNTSPRPVYQQIIDQVKRDIALGRIIKNDKLPTVRELAAQLVINPNTIAKAYRLLEQQGIIHTKPGSGAYIAQLDSNLSSTVREKIIIEQLEHLVIDAVHMQIAKSTLTEWFKQTVEKFNFFSPKGLQHE
jgi:GntR family transcriptional regulator